MMPKAFINFEDRMKYPVEKCEEGGRVETIWKRVSDQDTNEILSLVNCLKNINGCIIACHLISINTHVDENKEKGVLLVASWEKCMFLHLADEIANCSF